MSVPSARVSRPHNSDVCSSVMQLFRRLTHGRGIDLVWRPSHSSTGSPASAPVTGKRHCLPAEHLQPSECTASSIRHQIPIVMVTKRAIHYTIRKTVTATCFQLGAKICIAFPFDATIAGIRNREFQHRDTHPTYIPAF